MKLMSAIRVLRPLRQWLSDNKGVAAVEFALLTPVLLAAIAGISDGATLVLKQNAMHAGVSSAAQYIMAGGSDLTAAQQVGLTAWPSHTSNASLTAAKSCICAGAGGDCAALCPDGTVPNAYITVSAADQVSGWFVNSSISTQQAVRIR